MPFTQVMGKFKAGHLHSGGPGGKVVTDPKQAVAIMLSEKKAAASGKKYDQGGIVKKDGPATLKKGELVVPAGHPAFDQILALFKGNGNDQAEENADQPQGGPPSVAPRMPPMVASMMGGGSIAGGR